MATWLNILREPLFLLQTQMRSKNMLPGKTKDSKSNNKAVPELLLRRPYYLIHYYLSSPDRTILEPVC